MANFVEMAYNVESSGFNHRNRLVIELINDIFNIIMKIHRHVSLEIIKLAINIDEVTILAFDEMHRT